MKNELLLSSDISVTYQAAQLRINNFEELKSKVKEYSEKYKGLVATDETLNSIKSARAELNKLYRDIDDKRKAVKKEYNNPYRDFEFDVREIQNVLTPEIDSLSKQIDVIEDNQRANRTEKVQEIINDMAPNYGIDPKGIEIESSWTNKSMTKKKLLTVLKDGFTALKNKQDALEANKRLIEEHCRLKNVDSAGWVSQVNQDTNINQLISNIDRSIDKERKQREYDEAIKKATEVHVEDKTINKDTGEIIDDMSNKWTMAFRVKDDYDKLKLLSDFIKRNGINNEMIENLKRVEG